MINSNPSSDSGYHVKRSRKIAENCRKLAKNIAKFSLILKYYFPFYPMLADRPFSFKFKVKISTHFYQASSEGSSDKILRFP